MSLTLQIILIVEQFIIYCFSEKCKKGKLRTDYALGWFYVH